MVNPDSFWVRRAVEAKKQQKQTSAIIWSVICALLAILTFFQTEWFVRLYSWPGDEKLKQLMSADKKVQDQIREEHLASPQAMPIPDGLDYRLFPEARKTMLEKAETQIKKNQLLEAELEKAGVSIKALDAVILPAQEFTDVNCGQLGITPQAWVDAQRRAVWRFSVGGLTVRDGVGAARATTDGRPRIAIQPWSFASNKALRRAFLHEMFHAANVPAVTPFFLSFLQHDLSYWPQYRPLLDLEELNDDLKDKTAWVVLLGALTVLFFFLRKIRRLRSSGQPTSA